MELLAPCMDFSFLSSYICRRASCMRCRSEFYATIVYQWSRLIGLGTTHASCKSLTFVLTQAQASSGKVTTKQES